jgi:hypothetical protein
MLTKEYREGDLAVQTTEVTFLCIPIFKYKKVTTNNRAVAMLTVAKSDKKVKGFYETNNKSKKNK